MDRNVNSKDFRQNRAVERQLVGIAVATRVGFEPREVVARFEVNDPLDRFEPIDSDLAGESAVLGSCSSPSTHRSPTEHPNAPPSPQ
jgi:hypothetical protein